MSDAVVARMWMRCQGHVAHGTSRLHTSVRSLRLHHLGPAALGSVNRVETCTSVCNLYLYYSVSLALEECITVYGNKNVSLSSH